MKRFLIIALLLSSASYAAQTLRYAVRSTANGDTEMLINTSDGKLTINKELRKKDCLKTWDKTCFENKTYTGSIPAANAKKILDEILKNDLFKLKIEAFPQPGEDQYSIGLLVDGQKPRYINCTQSKLNEYKTFKKVHLELQKIVSKNTKGGNL